MNKLQYKSSVIKSIKVLPKNDRLKIEAFLDSLVYIPKPKNLPNCKKLSGYKEYYRYKIGNYRIVCNISDDGMITIVILRVAHRKDVYKHL